MYGALAVRYGWFPECLYWWGMVGALMVFWLRGGGHVLHSVGSSSVAWADQRVCRATVLGGPCCGSSDVPTVRCFCRDSWLGSAEARFRLAGVVMAVGWRHWRKRL